MTPLASTTLDKLSKVPTSFWMYAGIVVVAIIALVFFIRFLRNMNKIVLAIILLVVFSVVGFNWIYERNEPAVLTPFVDVVAQFLPSKGSYKETQKKEPDAPKEKKAPAPAKK